MTMAQILEKYKEQFITVIRAVGAVQNNTTFLEVEDLLNAKKFEENADSGMGFDAFVVMFIIPLLVNMYGVDIVSSWGNIIKRKEFRTIYDNYLKEITDNFTRKYGIRTVNIDELDCYVKGNSDLGLDFRF